MSNYSALKTAIQQAVYTNGNNEITGAGLQAVLLQIVNTVGDGYVFKGVATAGTAPGTPDANVFYIAPAGTYENFGSSYTVPVGSVGVFSWNGSWDKKSVQCLDYATVESPETVIEYNGNTGWQNLPYKLQAGLYSVTWYSYESVSGQVYVSNNANKAGYQIRIAGSSNMKNGLIYIPSSADYDCYYCPTSGTKVGLRKIEESELSNNLIKAEANHLSDIVMGYVSNAGAFVSQTSRDWLFAKISVTVGHYYLLPYSWMKNSVNPIAGLDANNNVVKTYSIGNQQNKIGYIIFKAETPKIGLTMRANLGSTFGTLLSLTDVMGLPYWDLSASTTRGDWLFDFIADNNQKITDLMPFTMAEVSDYYAGYYNPNGTLITNPAGSWKSAQIDAVQGDWYLINTQITTAIRIVDIDEGGNVSVNKSVPTTYYQYASSNGTSWALVRAGGVKIGVSFDLPDTNWNPATKHVAKYCHITRSNNNGLILLFVQLYQMLSESGRNGKTFIVAKNGGGDYDSLVEAVMDNMGTWGVTLHLEAGEYDLIQEFTDYYGTADFRSQTPSGRGLELGYNITIEGSPNAVIVADYTGSDEGMQKSFSPLNCYNRPSVGGMTLRGVNIRCSRVRYCVHDEKGTAGTGSYNNVYENCNFYIDNTDNDYWHSSQCIGGGLGTSGSIQIRNCILEEIEPSSPANAAVSYHNNANADAKSMITCTGNYVKGERGFRFSWYGQSTEITEVICANNSVGRATQYNAETQDTSPNQNVTLYDFNNIVRQ